jgi:hypothetical protein
VAPGTRATTPEHGPRGGPPSGSAILDRLLHHATTINIKGESYRLKEKRWACRLRTAQPLESRAE